MKGFLITFAVMLFVGTAYAEDWQLRALEAEAEVARLDAEVAQLLEENKVMRSWLEGKFKAAKREAVKDARTALEEYKRALEKKGKPNK